MEFKKIYNCAEMDAVPMCVCMLYFTVYLCMCSLYSVFFKGINDALLKTLLYSTNYMISAKQIISAIFVFTSGSQIIYFRKLF